MGVKYVWRRGFWGRLFIVTGCSAWLSCAVLAPYGMPVFLAIRIPQSVCIKMYAGTKMIALLTPGRGAGRPRF
jgi:hypothetical protein